MSTLGNRKDLNYHPKVLIIDIDETNAKLIAEILESENYRVQITINCKKALVHAQQHQPDLIILDSMMPNYNGLKVAQILKNTPETKNIPIIITTDLDSYNTKQDFNNNTDEILIKPVNPIELLTRVNTMFKLKIYRDQLEIRKNIECNFTNEDGIGKTKSISSDTRNHFLLIEDNSTEKSLIFNMLNQEQFIITLTNTGEQAIALVHNKLFDLIIINTVLPDMYGLDIYKIIKRIDLYQHTPIIFVSNTNDYQLKLACLEYGADDFFINPINNKEFMAKINLLLKKKTYTDQLYDNYQAAINSAIKDGLTNLFKRSYFIRCLDHEIKRTLRTMGCLSLMIIDIDNFKAINDHLGHLAGDAILYEFGKIILNNIRDIDQAARYGGEEFIILLPNTKKEKALLIAQRIQSALLEIPLPSNLPSILNKLTVSIGIAEFPCCATSSSELLNKADLMLYQAKKTGKNKVCL